MLVNASVQSAQISFENLNLIMKTKNGTNFNGLMVGPVNIEGTISIDGNYVVV